MNPTALPQSGMVGGPASAAAPAKKPAAGLTQGQGQTIGQDEVLFSGKGKKAATVGSLAAAFAMLLGSPAVADVGEIPPDFELPPPGEEPADPGNGDEVEQPRGRDRAADQLEGRAEQAPNPRAADALNRAAAKLR